MRRPEPLFEHDRADHVQHIFGTYVREAGKPAERLSRSDRREVVGRLDDAGVFAVRRAVPLVAGALKASRSTLYTLLAEHRAQRTSS
ncbi:helix-turn-helix domain-containing protein [Embleya sp. NPDC005575]|uniref:helix-turn-helix domain-containing protein n=1 Tax=Embleya sp. NPDC005575 TaxID=3156892 RepID=UPI0033A0E210